jgi:gas vesicle protein
MGKNHHNSNTAQNLLLGALAGTILGAAAAAILSSDKCKGLICDAYHQAEESIYDKVNQLSEKSQELTERFLPSKRKPQTLNLTIGAIAGGILGIAAIALLSGSSAKDLQEQVFHSFKCLSNKAHNLEDQACDAAENLQDKISSWVHTAEKFLNTVQGKKNHQHPIDKILDFATIAAQFIQSIRK